MTPATAAGATTAGSAVRSTDGEARSGSLVADRLLDPAALPCFSLMTPRTVREALDEGLRRYAATVEFLVRVRPTDFDTLWLPLERAETVLDAFWTSVTHLAAMTGEQALLIEAAAGEARLVEATTRVRQNPVLYRLLSDLEVSGALDGRPPADRAAVRRMVHDFELSGVALNPADQARFAACCAALTALCADFGRAVLEAGGAWSEHMTDPELLRGLPVETQAAFAASAEAAGLTGWLVTLHQTSVSAVLTFAQDRGLRARLYRAVGTRASDQGPGAGRFDNSGRIRAILALRHDAARLLGFETPAAWSLATKMATDEREVLVFLRDLARHAAPAARRDHAELASFASDRLGLEDLEDWDLEFVANRLREERFAVSEAEVRGYFPVDAVIRGWKTLLETLFGVRLEARDDVDLWSPEAVFYDVRDGESVIAGLYLDLHARPGKRGGAWMSSARPRLADGALTGRPAAYLNCNLAPKRADAPSLMSHAEIVTLLHETGHCLHHLFSRIERPNVAGAAGMAWDAVETPSQVMEDFAWSFDVLAGMSAHVVSGRQLPRAMFDALSAARHFQSGIALARQIEMSLFDMLVHEETAGDDPAGLLASVSGETGSPPRPAWHRLPHAFTHVFAGAYACGYYSYLWSEVLAADIFQHLAPTGRPDRKAGDRFRRAFLAKGASRPVGDSFRALVGREPDPGAMLARRGVRVERRLNLRSPCR